MYNIGSVSRMVVSENVLSAGVTRQPRALLKKGPALSYKTAVFKIWGESVGTRESSVLVKYSLEYTGFKGGPSRFLLFRTKYPV